MEGLIFPIVDFLSALVLAGGIIIALILLGFLPRFTKIHEYVSKHALLLMLIVATIATVGSLFLSEIAGWTPCKYCWLQRIFMYPQVVLLSIALWKRDRGVAQYILALCVIGAVLSTYHYIEQIQATFFAPPEDALVPCDASGVSCSKTYTFRFGYITIPMMALTGFVLNALGSLIVLRKK